MKTVSENTDSHAASAKTDCMTVSDFLRDLSETFRASDRRLYSRREGSDLVFALRSALASPARLFAQDSLTQECYRYLSLVNRTPISGLSLIACLGYDLPRQVSFSSRLQMYAAELTDRLRSGAMTPDSEVPRYILELYLGYLELLSRSSLRFDIDMDKLEGAINSRSTYHTLRNFIFKQFDANVNVPEIFIEAFVLAHAYLYRFSTLE